MFVKSNTLQATKEYFVKKLMEKFNERDIEFFFKFSAIQRLHLSSVDFYNMDTVKLSESDLLYFRSIANRLLTDEPFQHILGNTEFYNLVIKTDSRALIPRPETEELVDWIVQDYKNNFKQLNVLDVCTGTGCIAFALKNKFPHFIVSGIDISKDAIALANENAQLLNLEINLNKIDVFSFKLEMKFDIIVSNPPYITNKEKEVMHKNVLEFEPHLALFVEDNQSLIFYDKISDIAFKNLNEGGTLYFEINEFYGKETVDLIQSKGFKFIELRKDLQGKDRMIKAIK